MTTNGGVPDAWDDDWVSKADVHTPVIFAYSQVLISSEIRCSSTTGYSKASQAIQGRETSPASRVQQTIVGGSVRSPSTMLVLLAYTIPRETPQTSYLWDTRNDVPLAADFKPTIKKVLSRKPKTAPRVGIDGLTLEEDDEEENENAAKPLTLEERQLKAQKEREEKQKKYQEARQRILGNTDPTSGTKSPGHVTPPSRNGGGLDSRNRGRGERNRESRPLTPADSSKARQLYDPNFSAKPDSASVQKRDGQIIESGPSTPLEEPIRAPRGPDGSGRGGFGFASRGR